MTTTSIKVIFITILSLGLFNCKEAVQPVVKPEVMKNDNNASNIPIYVPDDQALYDAILAMDKKYFDAYNTCDLETQANIYKDNIEFYHDKGGLQTDKEALIRSIEEHICGKVTRQLVEGSMEVYPIAGYGAIAEGYHTFFNKLEPDAPQKPSKFITIWEDTPNGWKMARVISLH